MVDEIKLYTPTEVGEIMKVKNVQTIYRYIRAGKLKAAKYGKEYRITEENLKRFIETGRS